MRRMRAGRVQWIGLAAAAILAAGCGTVAESGSTAAETGDPSMTSSTSTTDDSSEGAAASETEDEQAAPSESGSESSDPSNAEADCAATQGWDTATERADFSLSGAISGVTAAAADCYDSVSIRIEPAEDAPGYTVAYVPEVVMDGSGAPVPLTSAARLQVIVTTPAYQDDGGTITPTLNPDDHDQLVDAGGLAVIEQVAYAGSFEGQTTFGIGVTAELPFTVTTDRGDDGGTTLTVSIAHA